MSYKAKKPFARKRFGQHFLNDGMVMHEILAAADLTETDLAVEIGPGRAVLTKEIVKQAGQVIAIEIDRDLIKLLNVEFALNENFRLIDADVLNVDFSEILKGTDKRVKLVANLPYNISTPLVMKLIKCRHLFYSLTVMLQKEVAERLARDWKRITKKDYGSLSVVSAICFRSKWVCDVGPESFNPPPKVNSAVVQLFPKEVVLENESKFFSWVRQAFIHKRKKIWPHLMKMNPELKDKDLKNWEHWFTLRPDDISPDEYLKFYQENIL